MDKHLILGRHALYQEQILEYFILFNSISGSECPKFYISYILEGPNEITICRTWVIYKRNSESWKQVGLQ